MSLPIVPKTEPFEDLNKKYCRRLTLPYPPIFPIFYSIKSLKAPYQLKNLKNCFNIHLEFYILIKSIANVVCVYSSHHGNMFVFRNCKF